MFSVSFHLNETHVHTSVQIIRDLVAQDRHLGVEASIRESALKQSPDLSCGGHPVTLEVTMALC